MDSDPVSDASFLTLTKFKHIHSGQANPHIFVGVNFLTNSFDASQVHVNPLFDEVDVFRQALPDDGVSLICRQRQPRWGMVAVQAENAEDFPRRTIEELKNYVEIGKARIHCTVYAIDTDWAWYYIKCRSCNKKVEKVNDGDNGLNNNGSKPRFWCYKCNTVVTNVVPRFMLYANVMDATGETKLLLFDSICSEIIRQSAPSVLGGSVDEVS
ncbi:PREDICTED: uncharacterized protein LOC109131222 [Camelina sativa]|uniref:Uncharacterized protein LOC109131222 n=1 Tax=Camelina sativa TaxID=90675 RepID=A0ABM1REM1_CAMSA|nr:PREDICTED: uncharacterized protein LOC109131222 [Camelina sativa]